MHAKKLLTTNGLQNKRVCDNLGMAGQVHQGGRRHAGHNKRVFSEKGDKKGKQKIKLKISKK